MFHCLVIKVSVVFDSLFTLPHLFELVKNFFQVFSKFFFRCVVASCLLTTYLLYHVFSYLSTTFFVFWKTFDFSCFQKQLFPTAQLDYHSRIHLSTTFFIFFQISFHNAEATLLSGVPVVLSISAYFFLAQMRFFSGMLDFLLLFSEKNRRKAADRPYPPILGLDFISYFRVYCVFHLFSLLFCRIKCCVILFSLISRSFL